MSVGTGFARRGSRCVYACSLSPAGKTQSTFSNICHPLGVFFLFPHVCVPSPGGERESGRNLFSFFLLLQSVSKFLKVEFPADYAEVKHGGS